MKKKYLFQSLKPYREIIHSQSPIEQQFYRSRLNLITILISLFILISITIGVYYCSKYFIGENILKKEIGEIMKLSNRTKRLKRPRNILLNMYS
jgi:hypothetical protein